MGALTAEAATSAALALHEARLAAESIPDLKRARQQAIWDLYHETGLNHLEIEDMLAAELRGRGLSGEDIFGLGISHDSIRRVTGTRRKPKTRP